jgi:hypothetical protein
MNSELNRLARTQSWGNVKRLAEGTEVNREDPRYDRASVPRFEAGTC